MVGINTLIFIIRLLQYVQCIKQERYTQNCMLTLTTSCMSWPHISSRFCAMTALRSLLWNSFPSKKSQGQHIRKGTGAPQASLARRAISTPCMKSVASWTPRAVTRSSFRRASPSESSSSGEQAVTRKASSSKQTNRNSIPVSMVPVPIPNYRPLILSTGIWDPGRY